MEKKNGKRLKRKKGKGRRKGKRSKAEKKAGRLGTERDTGEGDRGAGQRRGERRVTLTGHWVHKSKREQSRKNRVQIAPHLPGLLPAPPQERRLGVRRRPPAFVTGSVRGRGLPRWALFWRSRAGPLRTAASPPSPSWGRWGWGRGVREGDQRSSSGRLRAWDFFPSLLSVIELLFSLREGARAAREEGERERRRPFSTRSKGGAALPARGRGFVWYACMHGWMETCMYA